MAALASGRVGGLGAGIAGLLAAAPALYVLRTGDDPLAGFLWHTTLAGAWLAWQAIAVMVAGLFFHRATHDRAAAATQAAPERSYRALFRTALLVGVFLESLTGFGVGYLIAFAAVRRLGVRGVEGVVLPMFSQSLVAWGALAVGTHVGANLAGVPVRLVGLWTLVIAVPVLFVYLVFFWRVASRAGFAPTPRDRLIDVAAIASMLALIGLANYLDRVEIAGLVGAGGVLAAESLVRALRGQTRAIAAQLARAWPFVLVTGVILLLRVVPPLRAAANAVLVSRPFEDGPAFAWLYHPMLFLVAGGLLALTAGGRLGRLGVVCTETARQGWRPVVVTLVYVVFAMWMSRSGVAAALADSALATFGVSALLASPLIGALGGFLTGSNTGSNAMAMPIQAGLAAHANLAPGQLAGIQNAVGSNFAIIAPPRIAMARGLAENALAEREIYRALVPFGIVSLAVATLALGLGLALR